MVAGRVGAVIDEGRGTLRPLFLIQAMATFDGMATVSISRSLPEARRARPTTTKVPPGARYRRKWVRASLNGMWWTAATQVMTSYGPGGISLNASPRVKVTEVPRGVSCRA